jgi:hypothetical protein
MRSTLDVAVIDCYSKQQILGGRWSKIQSLDWIPGRARGARQRVRSVQRFPLIQERNNFCEQ